MKRIIKLAVFSMLACLFFSCDKEEGYQGEYVSDLPLRIHINLVNERGESYVEGKMVEKKFPNLKVIDQGKEYYFNKKTEEGYWNFGYTEYESPEDLSKVETISYNPGKRRQDKSFMIDWGNGDVDVVTYATYEDYVENSIKSVWVNGKEQQIIPFCYVLITIVK